MLLLECKVLNAATLGPLKKDQAFLRYICCVISQSLLGFGWLPVLWDKQRRALHDSMASSLVVETDSEYDDDNDQSDKSLEQIIHEGHFER